MRDLAFLPIVLAMGGCGSAAMGLDGAPASESAPAVCDLRLVAPTLLGTSRTCPPARCTVEADGSLSCDPTAATWSGGKACTRFELPAGLCAAPCAPAVCTVNAVGEASCGEACSADDTTCFTLPAEACASTAP